MEEQEKKEMKKKNDYLEKFISNIKFKEGERSKDCNKKASLFLSFSFNKPKSKAEECLFNLGKENFLIKEADYFKKEKDKKKLLMKSLSKKELEEFSKSYDNYKNEYNKKSEEKQLELFNEWKSRKEKLPNFISSFFGSTEFELKKKSGN